MLTLHIYTVLGKKCLGKEKYVEVENPQDSNVVKDLCNKVMKDKLFGFLQVDIQVPNELLKKFSEFSLLFIINSIPEKQIPQHMKDYQERTGRSTIRGTTKLLGVARVDEILLYTLMLKWYLSHGLMVTAIHTYLEYQSRKPFVWFPEEVSKARHDGDKDPTLKQLGDTYELKGNSFYGKMIEDLMRHLRTIFTTNEDLVDQSFRSRYFKDLEEINGAFKIKVCKR